MQGQQASGSIGDVRISEISLNKAKNLRVKENRSCNSIEWQNANAENSLNSERKRKNRKIISFRK